MTPMAFRSPAINRNRGQRRRAGFTLVEALMAAVVLAVAVTGLFGELAASGQQTLALQQTSTSIGLARELQEEIAAKPLANPSSGSTTPVTAVAVTTSTTQPSTITRSTFTYAGSYNGYTDYGSDLYTLGGTTIDATGSQNYCRSVSVTTGAAPSNDTASPKTDFGLVTVTVTSPSGQKFQISRVVTNYTFSR
jgi:Tfp pilus assembly protein PilV